MPLPDQDSEWIRGPRLGPSCFQGACGSLCGAPLLGLFHLPEGCYSYLLSLTLLTGHELPKPQSPYLQSGTVGLPPSQGSPETVPRRCSEHAWGPAAYLPASLCHQEWLGKPQRPPGLAEAPPLGAAPAVVVSVEKPTASPSTLSVTHQMLGHALHIHFPV